MTKTYDFAGEEVKVTETVPADSCKAAEHVVTDASTRPADKQEAKKTKLVGQTDLHHGELICEYFLVHKYQ